MENWRDIKDYEGLYQVSDDGRVWSVIKDKNRRGGILKATKTKGGYLQVGLSNNGVKKTYIHRLVAEAFIPNPLNLTDVNHKNEDKTDNSVENLEWCDHKYNCNYGTRNKRCVEKQSKPVLQYSLVGTFIREWSSIGDVQRQLGYCKGHISKCCLGRIKTAYGFIWKYKEVV